MCVAAVTITQGAAAPKTKFAPGLFSWDRYATPPPRRGAVAVAGALATATVVAAAA